MYVKDRQRDGVGTEFKTHEAALRDHFWHRLGTVIDREACREYHKARRLLGYSNSTIRTDLALLRACLRWRYGEAAPDIWLPPASAPRDRWLTKPEARKLVDAAKSPHIRLFLILGLATGARSAAILDLTWGRIDFHHGTIDYRPPGRIQTNKRRTVVPMNATARKALEEAQKGALSDHVIEFGGKPIASVKKAIERLAKTTGIAVSPHVLRHTCAVWMAQADVPMQKISQYLGHTSLAMTASTYARYSPSFMTDAGGAVEF
jgi:integrase